MLVGKVMAALVGFSEGMIVGLALVAFLTVLDVIPRLAWLTGTSSFVSVYQWILVGGVVFAAGVSLWSWSFPLLWLLVPLVGLTMGCFVGMMAAALAEVTNVLPVLSKRLNLGNYLKYIGVSIISGKVLGSIIYWLVPRLR